MKIYGEILAGGKGTRMGNTEKPKQFLNLGDKPILIHTLEQFLLNQEFAKVLVLCPQEWIAYCQDIIRKYLGANDRVALVKGGGSRNETILNGCRFIESEYGLDESDIVITHDAVRPFVNQRILKDNIELIKSCDAVDTVIEATDTIVVSTDGESISSIPVRNEMYQGQTPQSFRITELMKLYDSLSEEEKKILTDACKIFILKGKKVQLVKGEVYNMKVTTLHDLKLANAILSEHKL